ncbi:MAG: alpha/beta fold hydrolase [Halodesulfurarchaeum sp.]
MNVDTWTDEQRTTTVAVDGHGAEIAYYEAGTDNDGPPVVFVHGIPTWSYLWEPVVEAVAGERHVVAMDMIGYGNSTMADGIDRSIRAQEQALAGLVDQLGSEQVSLVGHDIGGGVVSRFAVHQPGRVPNLVLSNAVCYDSWPVSFINGLGVPSTLERAPDELEAELREVLEEGVYGEPTEHEDFVEGMVHPWTQSGGWRSLVRNAVATNTNHTLELEYGDIEADTTLLWGADDILQPIDYAERLAEDVGGDATVVPIEDAYHWVVEDRPEEYREELLEIYG